jgi:uncharacterized integral membrane protein
MAEIIHKSYNNSMLIFFILGLILGGVAVVFALQNIADITVVFLGWQLSGSMSLILLLTLLTGVLVTLLILLPKSIGDYFKYKRLQRENARLTEELRKQKELTLFAKTTSPSPETITKIEDGAISHPKPV